MTLNVFLKCKSLIWIGLILERAKLGLEAGFVFLLINAAERVARIEGSQQRSLRACWETIRDRTR